MERPLLTEPEIVQNSGLGASLLRSFATGHLSSRPDEGIEMPLLFIVLPLVFHARTREYLLGTRRASGMLKFEEKFEKTADLLFAIAPRVSVMKELTLRALEIALLTDLLILVPESAMIWPGAGTLPKPRSKEVRQLIDASERLGVWSGLLDPSEVAFRLRLEF